MALSDALRAAGSDDTAVDALIRTASRRSPERFAALINSMHDAGRPVDIDRLLAHAARLPADDIAGICATLQGDDTTRLFTTCLYHRQPDEVANLVEALRRSGQETDQLLRLATAPPTAKLTSLAERIGPHDREQLLTLVAAQPGNGILAVVQVLQGGDDSSQLIIDTLAQRPEEEISTIVAALRSAKGTPTPCACSSLLRAILPRRWHAGSSRQEACPGLQMPTRP